MKSSIGKPTKAQQVRLNAIHSMRCIACEKEKVLQPSRTEAHHLVDKGTRKHSGGHDATIPLCGWHHRAELVEYLSFKEMHLLYGPSLAAHKREFINVYGSERELLEQVNDRLREDAAA